MQGRDLGIRIWDSVSLMNERSNERASELTVSRMGASFHLSLCMHASSGSGTAFIITLSRYELQKVEQKSHLQSDLLPFLH
jgi:hypothetical protein